MSPRANRKPADPRHADVRELLAKVWAHECPASPELPWEAADAGALGSFLRSSPALDLGAIKGMLRNRLLSDDHPPGERVFRWIRDLHRYAAGPLNKYRQPKERGNHGKRNRADEQLQHAAGATNAALARLQGVAGDGDR